MTALRASKLYGKRSNSHFAEPQSNRARSLARGVQQHANTDMSWGTRSSQSWLLLVSGEAGFEPSGGFRGSVEPQYLLGQGAFEVLVRDMVWAVRCVAWCIGC